MAQILQFPVQEGPHSPGVRKPFTSYIGMIIFLASWGMLFGSLFFSYALLRVESPLWPPPGILRLPRVLPGINTLILLASSFTIQAALQAARRNRSQAIVPYLLYTFGLGVIFLGLQLWIWRSVWLAGLHIDSALYG